MLPVSEGSHVIAEYVQDWTALSDGTPCIVITKEEGIEEGQRITLRDPNVAGNPVLAIMDVEQVENVTDDELKTMAEQIFGTPARK